MRVIVKSRITWNFDNSTGCSGAPSIAAKSANIYFKENHMAGKNTAVFGIYGDQARVDSAVDALRDEGFRAADISVLFPE